MHVSLTTKAAKERMGAEGKDPASLWKLAARSVEDREGVAVSPFPLGATDEGGEDVASLLQGALRGAGLYRTVH